MEGCPVKFALGLVSGKWKLRILWDLCCFFWCNYNTRFWVG